MANSRRTWTLARVVTAGIAVAFLTTAAPLPSDAAPQMPSPSQRLPKPKPTRKPPSKPSDPAPSDDRAEPKADTPDTKQDPKSAAKAAAKAPGAKRIWLDEPLKNWNTAGATLPAAPKGGDQQYAMDDRCKDSLRTGNAPEDAQVTGAGWFLFGPRQVFGDVTLVSAMAGVDGMCRPMGHQSFVFVGGTFAGTIAPQPMGSRFDGDADRLFLYGSRQLTVEFRRYAESDPLCCPSGRATVTYTIDRGGAGPLLVPTGITPDTK